MYSTWLHGTRHIHCTARLKKCAKTRSLARQPLLTNLVKPAVEVNTSMINVVAFFESWVGSQCVLLNFGNVALVTINLDYY